MPAKNTPKTITAAQAARNLLEMFPTRVVQTWLQEFGYTQPDVVAGLQEAVAERGPRIRRELIIHAKRLADRQTMGHARVTSRSSVIR